MLLSSNLIPNWTPTAAGDGSYAFAYIACNKKQLLQLHLNNTTEKKKKNKPKPTHKTNQERAKIQTSNIKLMDDGPIESEDVLQKASLPSLKSYFSYITVVPILSLCQRILQINTSEAPSLLTHAIIFNGRLGSYEQHLVGRDRRKGISWKKFSLKTFLNGH